jgi:hypothetical protein
MIVISEISQTVSERLVMNAARDVASRERLLANDVLLYGFDCTAEASYELAHTLLIELSDAIGNETPSALVGLKESLGMSNAIRARVRNSKLFAFA